MAKERDALQLYLASWVDAARWIDAGREAGEQETALQLGIVEDREALAERLLSLDCWLEDGRVMVNEGLRAWYLTELDELPRGLTVAGNLSLPYCSKLTCIPDAISIAGNLNLRGCRSLTALPDSLKIITGDLNLNQCTALTALPRGLNVSGQLDLSDCSRIADLPSDLKVGSHLVLENCENLESLPSSILSWPERTRDSGDEELVSPLHDVYLGGSGLSIETLEWLENSDAPNVRFHVNLLSNRGRHLVQPPFAHLTYAIQFWVRESCHSTGHIDIVDHLSPLEADALLEFLSKLRGSKEFGIMETRRALALRVVAVLGLLYNPEYRSEIIQRMEDSLDACHDKPIWALNQLTLVGLISSARGDRNELRRLGRRVMNLQIVHEHAQKKVASLKESSVIELVDDVCVFLRFEIELRESLNLPVDATAMIFTNYIEVTDAELQAAEAEAEGVTEEAFEVWLSSWSEWARQDRLEAARELRWVDLPCDKSITSPGVPRSDLSGEELCDPISLRGQVWSLRDLLRHWIVTGLDPTNTVLRCDELPILVQRVKLP
eukprot:CAMPEP_0184527408 /NCGR_PEP_ID=MMETSP0198_2-20121128/11181_1 /TAXON_ID=1112570 /ORGANISM="Thraustochytrium sp., Strain LLF1b" /LENGTH=550 /DNA_ID=CAMNT_0026919063 /DNA_START=146 /DNA_END=1795 /DNA_ORIENTATION=-